MTHSDDKGLIVPPKMASIHVVIVPIIPKPEAKAEIEKVATELSKSLGDGVLVHVDTRDIRHGEKYFEWEKKGVPLRVEIGPKDIEKKSVVLVRRDTGEKEVVTNAELKEKVMTTLQAIQKNLFDKALAMRTENTVSVDSWDEFTAALEARKFVLAHWDGTTATEKLIKEETGATIRCIPLDNKQEDGVCIKTGKPSKERVIFAKAH